MLLMALCGASPLARSEGTNTNVVAAISFNIGEAREVFQNGYRLPGLFEGHFADRLTNRITNYRFLLHLMREEFQPAVVYGDRGENYTQGAFLDGLSRAARDWFLEEVPVSSFVRGELRDILVDSISGREERGILRSPFHASEGLYTWDDPADIRGLRFGFRPLRLSPYGYVGYSERDFVIHLRYYYSELERHRLEILVRVPLIKSRFKDRQWDVHFGYQFDWDQFLTTRGERNGEQENVGRFAAGLGGWAFGGELFMTGYAGRERPLGFALTWRKGL